MKEEADKSDGDAYHAHHHPAIPVQPAGNKRHSLSRGYTGLGNEAGAIRDLIS